MKTRTLKKLKPIRIIGTIALVSAIVLAGVLGFNIYKDTEAFDADKLLSSGASVMYDSNGEVMLSSLLKILVSLSTMVSIYHVSLKLLFLI